MDDDALSAAGSVARIFARSSTPSALRRSRVRDGCVPGRRRNRHSLGPQMLDRSVPGRVPACRHEGA